MKFFEKLNKPMMVLIVFMLFLAVDGFLFYRYQQSIENAYKPVSGVDRLTTEETTTTTSSSSSSLRDGGITTPEETTASPEDQESSMAEEAATSPAAQEKLKVLITVVNAPSWLRIQQDGQVVLNQLGEPGFSQEFEANKEIRIRAGNAGAVEVAANGENLGALGESGEVLTRTYTL